jgi:hypothetical protein
MNYYNCKPQWYGLIPEDKCPGYQCEDPCKGKTCGLHGAVCM